MARLGRAGRTRRRNAKIARAARALQQRQLLAETKLNGAQFAFSVIVNGIGYTSAAKVFLQNNIVPPSQTSFYIHVRGVIDQIIALGKESAADHRRQMEPGTIISLDGSWDHRRNGRYCIVDAVDLKRKKIIAIHVLQRSTKAHPSTYSGSAQNMEVYCCRLLATELCEDARIIGYCHDNDSAVRKVFTKMCPKWTEYLDPNHTMKSFDRHFTTCNASAKGKLADIRESLIHFMYFLIDYPVRVEDKVAFWRNAVNHYRGDHSRCPRRHEQERVWVYRDDKDAIDALTDLLSKTEGIIRHCVKPFSTQLNESFHAIKSHMMFKEFAWHETAIARLYLSMLTFNQVPNWTERLRERLNLPPLDPSVIRRMREMERKREGQCLMRRTAAYQREERLRRVGEKTKRRRLDTSGYVGRPKTEG